MQLGTSQGVPCDEVLRLLLRGAKRESTQPAAPLTTDQIRSLLRQDKLDELLGECLRVDVTPFVFEPRPHLWPLFRDELALALGVASSGILVAGSARFGFSLRPDRNFASFRDTSDIDLVVVDPAAFDLLWFALLRAAYPRPPITEQVGGWLHKRQKELYTGWLSPLKTRLDKKIFGPRAEPVLKISAKWFDALGKASRYPPRRYERISGRLYRSLGHVELYHMDSLLKLRRSALK